MQKSRSFEISDKGTSKRENCSIGRTTTPAGRRTLHQGRLTPFEPDKASQQQGLFKLLLFSFYDIIQNLYWDPDAYMAAAWPSSPGTADFFVNNYLRDCSYIELFRYLQARVWVDALKPAPIVSEKVTG